MPTWPQHNTAVLVEYANFVTGKDANYTANAGDFVTFTPTAARTLTLPAVTVGGPVAVALEGAFGAGFAVKIVPNSGDSSAILGLATGSVTSVTLNNAGDSVVLVTDGVNWRAISKAHNTHDTF